MVKTLLNILQTQKSDYLGTWYVAWGMWDYQVCPNDDPRLTLNYLASRSNLLPNAFKWEFDDFFMKTVEAKVFILT